MYYYLIGALRRRLILELQDSFSKHPVYRKVVPNIQNRFAFDARPQFAIVVKGSSSNKVQFSPDNYMGQINSHVMLAYVGEPCFPIEWVREDLKVVQATGGMPTLPGVYYIEILSAPSSEEETGYFAVDPLLTATSEALLLFQSGLEMESQLQQIPVSGTLRLYDNNYLLTENVDYTVSSDGKVVLLKPMGSPNSRLTADYRYVAPSLGPIPFSWNTSDATTLPGVVLAFGKRSEKGQKVAVVVYPDRVQTAEVYGGKFETTFDLDVIARDTIQVEEMADLSVMYLWNNKKSALELEGIEVVDVSIGGESEDPADETGQLFFYTINLSVQLRADWEAHVPMPLTISKASPTTQTGANGINAVQSHMLYASNPIFVGRNNDFERIT